MRARIKKLLQLALGWGLLFLGVIGLFLPILQGVLFIMLGLMVLSYHMPWAECALRRLRERFPKVHAAMHEWAKWGLAKLRAWGFLCRSRTGGDDG
ncbi:MAG: PGPGW domain-containing protein [Pseudomonadota bacterium]